MKDLETTWSHIVWRKLSVIREDRGMSLSEIGDKTWKSTAFIGAILARTKKWSEDAFMQVWLALGIPKREIDDILLWSIYEAMEEEYWAWFTFALKNKFRLSDKGVKDVLKFISDVQKMENE